MVYADWKRDFGSYFQETCKVNAGCSIRSSVDIISKRIRIILRGLKEGWFAMYKGIQQITHGLNCGSHLFSLTF
jgi:hypothetical protein